MSLQEILMALHISVGPTDTINIKQLLFQDLVELSCHIQVNLFCLLFIEICSPTITKALITMYIIIHIDVKDL